jgi:hypothetical protein
MLKARRGKPRGRSQSAKRVTADPKNPDELQNARNRVTNVIVDASVDMTRRVVRSVNERGNVQALRFLWEIAGMFPPAATTGGDDQGSMAKSLIESLGLYRAPGSRPGVGNDGKADVESE